MIKILGLYKFLFFLSGWPQFSFSNYMIKNIYISYILPTLFFLMNIYIYIGLNLFLQKKKEIIMSNFGFIFEVQSDDGMAWQSRVRSEWGCMENNMAANYIITLLIMHRRACLLVASFFLQGQSWWNQLIFFIFI